MYEGKRRGPQTIKKYILGLRLCRLTHWVYSGRIKIKSNKLSPASYFRGQAYIIYTASSELPFQAIIEIRLVKEDGDTAASQRLLPLFKKEPAVPLGLMSPRRALAGKSNF
jgi:hypothetical protein